MTLLFLDTETGGTVDGVSVLTITLTAFRFETDKIIKISELDLKVRPDDSMYVINPEALVVNKIDLIAHHKDAITYTEAGRQIYDYLSLLNREIPIGKPTVVGQNVQFDLNHIFKSKIISKASWQSLTDIRIIDTVAISRFAQVLGLIPASQSLSLSKLATFLGIEMDTNRLHTSSYDNEITAKVLFELGKLLNVS